jgi:hypothetical protein
MASGRKPVIIRKLSRDWQAGYAFVPSEQGPEVLEVLDLDGKVVTVDWGQIKWICFLRDLPSTGDIQTPERLLQKKFRTRPRTAGLWLRLRLIDQDEIEGIARNDISLALGAGLLLTPPDTRSNVQRILVPRTSIESLEVVGLIGSTKKHSADEKQIDQPELFPPEPDGNSGTTTA